jgi:hypothetical protein
MSVGSIFHLSSQKLFYFCEEDNLKNPDNSSDVLLNSKDKEMKDLTPFQFRFLPVQGAGHFGYIEHVASGKVVHPYGGQLEPQSEQKVSIPL